MCAIDPRSAWVWRPRTACWWPASSPAAAKEVAVRQGDVILEVNEQKVTSVAETQEAVRARFGTRIAPRRSGR
jgi:hypothetical protein